MIDSQQLSRLSQLAIETIDKNDLIEITDVQIDQSLSAPLRMIKYLDEIKNPYCFTCAGIPVRISFTPDGDTLETRIKNYFIALKR